MFGSKPEKEHHDLILSCIPQLRSYARSLTRHKDSADDLVQDCMQKALEKIHLWQSGSSMRAWLFTIMHNIHVDQVRRQVSGPQFVSSQAHDLLNTCSHATAASDEDAGLDALGKAMSSLSAEHREVIHLVCMEEMKYADVAAVLGIPVGTVMSRLNRGREQLRSIMFDNKQPNLRRVK